MADEVLRKSLDYNTLNSFLVRSDVPNIADGGVFDLAKAYRQAKEFLSANDENSASKNVLEAAQAVIDAGDKLAEYHKEEGKVAFFDNLPAEINQSVLAADAVRAAALLGAVGGEGERDVHAVQTVNFGDGLSYIDSAMARYNYGGDFNAEERSFVAGIESELETQHGLLEDSNRVLLSKAIAITNKDFGRDVPGVTNEREAFGIIGAEQLFAESVIQQYGNTYGYLSDDQVLNPEFVNDLADFYNYMDVTLDDIVAARNIEIREQDVIEINSKGREVTRRANEHQYKQAVTENYYARFKGLEPEGFKSGAAFAEYYGRVWPMQLDIDSLNRNITDQLLDMYLEHGETMWSNPALTITPYHKNRYAMAPMHVTDFSDGSVGGTAYRMVQSIKDSLSQYTGSIKVYDSDEEFRREVAEIHHVDINEMHREAIRNTLEKLRSGDNLGMSPVTKEAVYEYTKAEAHRLFTEEVRRSLDNGMTIVPELNWQPESALPEAFYDRHELIAKVAEEIENREDISYSVLGTRRIPESYLPGYDELKSSLEAVQDKIKEAIETGVNNLEKGLNFDNDLSINSISIRFKGAEYKIPLEELALNYVKAIPENIAAVMISDIYEANGNLKAADRYMAQKIVEDIAEHNKLSNRAAVCGKDDMHVIFVDDVVKRINERFDEILKDAKANGDYSALHDLGAEILVEGVSLGTVKELSDKYHEYVDENDRLVNAGKGIVEFKAEVAREAVRRIAEDFEADYKVEIVGVVPDNYTAYKNIRFENLKAEAERIVRDCVAYPEKYKAHCDKKSGCRIETGAYDAELGIDGVKYAVIIPEDIRNIDVSAAHETDVARCADAMLRDFEMKYMADYGQQPGLEKLENSISDEYFDNPPMFTRDWKDMAVESVQYRTNEFANREHVTAVYLPENSRFGPTSLRFNSDVFTSNDGFNPAFVKENKIRLVDRGKLHAIVKKYPELQYTDFLYNKDLICAVARIKGFEYGNDGVIDVEKSNQLRKTMREAYCSAHRLQLDVNGKVDLDATKKFRQENNFGDALNEVQVAQINNYLAGLRDITYEDAVTETKFAAGINDVKIDNKTVDRIYNSYVDSQEMEQRDQANMEDTRGINNDKGYDGFNPEYLYLMVPEESVLTRNIIMYSSSDEFNHEFRYYSVERQKAQETAEHKGKTVGNTSVHGTASAAIDKRLLVNENIKPGMVINHVSEGKGEILSVDRENSTLEIKFDYGSVYKKFNYSRAVAANSFTVEGMPELIKQEHDKLMNVSDTVKMKGTEESQSVFYADSALKNDKVKAGMVISHAGFGKGRIVEAEGDSLKIRFDNDNGHVRNLSYSMCVKANNFTVEGMPDVISKANASYIASQKINKPGANAVTAQVNKPAAYVEVMTYNSGMSGLDIIRKSTMWAMNKELGQKVDINALDRKLGISMKKLEPELSGTVSTADVYYKCCEKRDALGDFYKSVDANAFTFVGIGSDIYDGTAYTPRALVDALAGADMRLMAVKYSLLEAGKDIDDINKMSVKELCDEPKMSYYAAFDTKTMVDICAQYVNYYGNCFDKADAFKGISAHMANKDQLLSVIDALESDRALGVHKDGLDVETLKFQYDSGDITLTGGEAKKIIEGKVVLTQIAPYTDKPMSDFHEMSQAIGEARNCFGSVSLPGQTTYEFVTDKENGTKATRIDYTFKFSQPLVMSKYQKQELEANGYTVKGIPQGVNSYQFAQKILNEGNKPVNPYILSHVAAYYSAQGKPVPGPYTKFQFAKDSKEITPLPCTMAVVKRLSLEGRSTVDGKMTEYSCQKAIEQYRERQTAYESMPATSAQKDFMKRFRMEIQDNLTYKAAYCRIIDKIRERGAIGEIDARYLKNNTISLMDPDKIYSCNGVAGISNDDIYAAKNSAKGLNALGRMLAEHCDNDRKLQRQYKIDIAPLRGGVKVEDVVRRICADYQEHESRSCSKMTFTELSRHIAGVLYSGGYDFRVKGVAQSQEKVDEQVAKAIMAVVPETRQLKLEDAAKEIAGARARAEKSKENIGRATDDQKIIGD